MQIETTFTVTSVQYRDADWLVILTSTRHRNTINLSMQEKDLHNWLPGSKHQVTIN